jgi:hypothetical protein
METQRITTSTAATNLADILERVLDKGLVIAGDISIKLADIELINIRIRLLIASVDKAKEIGINWWETDSYLSPKAKESEQEKEKQQLERRIKSLEAQLKSPRRLTAPKIKNK